MKTKLLTKREIREILKLAGDDKDLLRLAKEAVRVVGAARIIAKYGPY
jgi:hypothetical protein